MLAQIRKILSMAILNKVLYGILNLPARIKGAKIGKNSVLGPGYDWLAVNLSGLTIGKNVCIGRRAWIQSTGNGRIQIGDGTNIGRDAVISTSSGDIKVGKKCLFSYRVTVLDHDHNFTVPDIFTSGETPADPVEIGDSCFIGASSFILKGVKLGQSCIVGANSVVTRSFPPGSIIAGNPAKKVGEVPFINDIKSEPS